MNVVLTVWVPGIAYDDFAGDSDLENYNEMGPT